MDHDGGRTRRASGAVAAAVLGLLLVAVLLPAATPPAQAAGPDTLTLVGRGWGHGHGLSQYGAQNAAANYGRTATQILDFYYPGTGGARAKGRVAVLITGDTSSDVVVDHRSGLTVRSLASGEVWSLRRSGARRWRLTALPGNRSTRVSVLTDVWRRVRDVPGEAEFRAGDRAIRLRIPGGSRLYRGRLRSAVPGDGRGRDTVNVLPLESYLRGVVPLEMPALWHREALRAQAVAARTYAAHARQAPHPRHYHLCDTSACQVYGGVGAEHPAATAAIDSAATRIRTHRGAPAFTQFSSSNGGWQAPGSQPYLVAREDPYDLWSGNPNTSWRVSVAAASVERAWPAIGDFTGIRVTRRDGNGSWGGRVLTVEVRGAQGSVTVSGDTFRSRLGLRSTLFSCPGGVAACP